MAAEGGPGGFRHGRAWAIIHANAGSSKTFSCDYQKGVRPYSVGPPDRESGPTERRPRLALFDIDESMIPSKAN
jgi:hypothetical protein